MPNTSSPFHPMSQHPLDQPASLRVDDLSHIPAIRPPAVNKQLMENSELQTSDSQREYASSRLRLANDKDANLAIIHEKPEHRLIVYLKASGKSNKEIAEATGYSYNHVCQIVRQPWFREAFVRLAHEQGTDAVSTFLQGEVLESLQTLKEIRDDPEEKGSTRVAATNAILDRALGKPTQFVKTENKNTNVPAEVDQLERELDSIKEQLRSKGVSAN